MNITAELIQPLSREKNICEMAIQKLQEKCKPFERKYHLSTKRFATEFNAGKLGDATNLFEWHSLCEAIKDWQKTLSSLKRLTK